MGKQQKILVIPRDCLVGYSGFVPWHQVAGMMSRVEAQVNWIERRQAEVSRTWVQPIPCTLVRNQNSEFCALRRVQTARKDLRTRISLLFGGHVDKHPGGKDTSLAGILRETLLRELHEELGIVSDHILQCEPIGLGIDGIQTVTRSMHVAFMYSTVVDQPATPRAFEEFAASTQLSGKFMNLAKLKTYRGRFDPWSAIAYDQYLTGSINTPSADLAPGVKLVPLPW